MKERKKQKGRKQSKLILKDALEKSLKDLQQQELSGSAGNDQTTSFSEIDDDEKEGLGDGNIKRSSEDAFGS